MEPFSPSAGCVGLLSIAAKTSSSVFDFIQNYCTAISELSAVDAELSHLRIVLGLLRNDGNAAVDGAVPQDLHKQIQSIIANCGCVLSEIDNALESRPGHAGALWWATRGKHEVGILLRSLEARRIVLRLAVGMVSMSGLLSHVFPHVWTDGA